MGDIERIAKLLRDESIDKQLAAAIVLGELRAKSPEVIDGLNGLLTSNVPPLQRNACEALARIGAKKSLNLIFPLLTAHAEEVRRAAHAAIAGVGEEVVPIIRKRMEMASAEERRALDAILAELGGADAFSALLAGLDASDPEAARAAALAVRHEIKRADARQRKNYLSQTEKFLAKKKTQGSQGAVVAALKILGYLEDEKAVPTLLAYATDASQPAQVRTEALISLRFAGKSLQGSGQLVKALLDAAEGADRVLAQTALHTLGAVKIPGKLLERLAKLAAHAEPDRAELAIGELGRRQDAEAAEALVEVLCKLDKRRAELAANALAGREDAIPALAKALLETKDHDRCWTIRNVLRPMAKKLKPATRKQLLDHAIQKLAGGERGWEAALDVARDADGKAAIEALRELASKLVKKKDDKALTVMSLVAKSEHATDDDLYRLASLELARSRRDTHPAARAGDEALKRLSALIDKGYDVATALRKDRSLDLEQLYYVGFHYTELRQPLGEEMLEEVVKKGGRSKLAKMAKNKLALATA